MCDSLYNTNSFVLTRDPDIPVLLKAPFFSATSSLLIPSLYYLPSTCFSLFASTTKTTQAAKKSVCWLRQDTTPSKRAPSPKIYFNKITYSFLILTKLGFADCWTKHNPSCRFLKDTTFSISWLLLILNKVRYGDSNDLFPFLFLTHVPHAFLYFL